jgi:hypothetical protein
VRTADGKEEIMNVCESAWRYTQNNQNCFGQHGAYLPTEEIVSMLQDQDALLLLMFLKAKNGPWNTFMVANGLSAVFHWRRAGCCRPQKANRDGLPRCRPTSW